MSYDNLVKLSDEAILSIESLLKEQGDCNSLLSITNQMIFIKYHTLKNENPVRKLGLKDKFTYGIISSKEFSSQEEMKVKEKLNAVSNALRSME